MKVYWSFTSVLLSVVVWGYTQTLDVIRYPYYVDSTPDSTAWQFGAYVVGSGLGSDTARVRAYNGTSSLWNWNWDLKKWTAANTYDNYPLIQPKPTGEWEGWIYLKSNAQDSFAVRIRRGGTNVATSSKKEVNLVPKSQLGYFKGYLGMIDKGVIIIRNGPDEADSIFAIWFSEENGINERNPNYPMNPLKGYFKLATKPSLSLYIFAYDSLMNSISVDSIGPFNLAAGETLNLGNIGPENNPPYIFILDQRPVLPIDLDTVFIIARCFDTDGFLTAESLYYQVNGGLWNQVSFNYQSGDTFRFSIPPESVNDSINYFIRVRDDSSAVVSSETLGYRIKANGENLVPNPDYEVWNGTPHHWHWESGITIAQESLNVNSGTYSTKVVLKSISNPTYYPDTISLRPGSLCSLSVYAYDTTTTGHIALGIVWYDYGHSAIAWLYGDSTDDSGWQSLAFKSQIPRNGRWAQLRIRFYDDPGFVDSVVFVVDNSFLAQYNGPPIITDLSNIPDAPLDDDTVIVKAVITDDYSLTMDSLYFRVNSENYNVVYHDSIKFDTFYYHITPDYGSYKDSIKYFIRAKDDSASVTSSAERFYIIGSGLQELLVNPGFEFWDNDTTPTSWVVDRSNLFAIKEFLLYHGGNFSLKVGPKRNYAGGKDVRQNVKPVIPGQRYHFSFWVYDNNDSVSARGWLQWRSSSIIQQDSTPYSVNSGQWQRLSVIYPMYAPSGAESVSINLRVYQDIDDTTFIYLDDVSFSGPTTAIKEVTSAFSPSDFILLNHPNPFSYATEIKWQVSRAEGLNDQVECKVRIYDAVGRLIRQWQSRTGIRKGSIIWCGDDQNGKPLPSGVYFLSVSLEGQGTELGKCNRIKKIILIR
ncbi:MAG: hypothetical protein ABIL70_05475 [candidate division WOR-3 bacterium]